MSDIAFDTITECIGDLTEGEAMSVFHMLTEKFGWTGTLFTREDAGHAFQNLRDDALTGEMPDEVWEAVQNNWNWHTGLTDRMTEIGWDFVDNAVSEVLSSTA